MEKLEKDKEEFRQQQEGEITKIKQLQNMAEEEKKKLIEKINKGIDEQKKVKDETKSLLMKYREKKKKVLNAGEIKKKVQEQESVINKHKEELMTKKKEEMKLKKALELEDKKNTELKKKYESTQANIDDLNEKIIILRNQIEIMKNDNKENQERFMIDLSNLQDDIRNIHMHNTKKEFIIETFIPQEEKEKVTKFIEYSDKEGIYFINRILAIKNN
jgi:hypothetical protein